MNEINAQRLLSIIIRMKKTTDSILEEYKSKPYADNRWIIVGFNSLLTEFQIWIRDQRGRGHIPRKNDFIQFLSEFIRRADVKIKKEEEKEHTLNWWYGIKLISHLLIDVLED